MYRATCVKKIMLEGHEVRDERGSLTKELQNVIIEITDPDDNTIPEVSPWHDDRLEKYKQELLDPDNIPTTPTYVFEKIPQGASTAIDNEFSSFSYNLDDYIGKTIYINFVNQN